MYMTLKEAREVGHAEPVCPECAKNYGDTGILKVYSGPNSQGEDNYATITLSTFLCNDYVHFHGTNFGLPETSNILTHEADRYGRYNRNNRCPLVNWRGD